jgi:hypothetical protein
MRCLYVVVHGLRHNKVEWKQFIQWLQETTGDKVKF